MELTFTYKPELKLYIAEFRADKEFNIHIERPEPGYISMQQNSAEGGKYAAVDDWGTQNNDKLIIDYESGYFVTPKFIKIISKVLPTYAAITTDGDVVEIKSQAKVVEITSNGTTSVEPDAGFSYLSKVDVKVDVPQSGGGNEGGSTGGGNDMVYLDLSAFSGSQGQQIKKMLMMFATDAVYIPFEGSELWYGPAAYAYPLVGDVEKSESLKRISFNLSQKLRMLMEFDDCPTVGDALRKMNFDPTSPETAHMILTEEEFYNLES